MWKDYFSIFGVLLFFYAMLRIAGGRLPKSSLEKSSNLPVRGFDSSAISSRIEQLRHDYTAQLPHRADAFKRQLRVAACREALQKQPFLHPTAVDELTAEPQS